MRSLFAISALGAICASLLLPSPVRADPCDGSHYEYDHGDCYDKTGSTTSDMLKMYDDGDRLQQDMIARSRPSLPSMSRAGTTWGADAHAKIRSMARSAYRLLRFTPLANSSAIDDLTHASPPQRGLTPGSSCASSCAIIARM